MDMCVDEACKTCAEDVGLDLYNKPYINLISWAT